MTVIDHTVERQAWPSFRVGTSAIEVAPLTATIGAELSNISLAEASRDDDLFAELRSLLLQYKVLFVRDQDITRAEHVALAERFGPLEDHPVAGSDPEHPGLVRIYKDLDSKPEHYENAFHCDATWREVPPLGSVLRCVEGPAVGGDTIWVNMAEAYRRLPAGVKAQIADLRARHSIEASFGAAMPDEQRRALHARFPDAEHPVVRTHPETGEEILFVNAFTTHFVELPHAGERPFRIRLLARRERTAQLPDPAGRRPGVPGPLAVDEEQLRHLGQPLHPALRRPGLLARRPKDGARRDRRRRRLIHFPLPKHICSRSSAMHFLDDSLFPENQEKLVITAAPYGPEWEPADFPEDIPLTMDQHVQQAVDCWEAGATVLHIHVRELDGKGSKRLSQFNELLRRLREAVPEMILQVGGSISFSPEGEDGDAKWLSDDTRHMLAELDPKPDQVTIAINTSQMNIVELMTDSDIAGTSFQRPELYEAYRNMEVPAGPEWVEEHLRRLTANGIQPHFQLAHSGAAGDGRAAGPPRRLHRPAQHHLGVHRRRLRRPQPVHDDGVHPPGAGRRVADAREHHAQRPADQHHGDRPGPAPPLRQRGHPLGPAGREAHLRRRRPPARAHRRRARPRGGHRQGSPRDLPARRVLGQRRRGAGQARLPAQPPSRPAGLPAPRLIPTN